MKYHQLHAYFVEAASEIRVKLAEAEIQTNHFSLVIEAAGRVNDGEVELTYSLGEYGRDVQGGDLDKVVQEFIRHAAWKCANAPKCLPKPSDEPSDEAIF